MKLGHRAGAFITFVDSFTEETILKVEAHIENIDLFSFHLYDSTGALVAESEDPQDLPEGLQVRASDGELLLQVPLEVGEDIYYRLYSHKGSLMTCSDGARTQIFGGLRIIGNKPLSGRPRTRPIEAPASDAPASVAVQE